MTHATIARPRAALVAAVLVAGGLFGMAGSASAAPLAPVPTGTLAAEGGVVAVRHGWGHHHHHHGWGHRHHGWRHGWHRGPRWGHHHHHHRGWGHRHRW